MVGTLTRYGSWIKVKKDSKSLMRNGAKVWKADRVVVLYSQGKGHKPKTKKRKG